MPAPAPIPAPTPEKKPEVSNVNPNVATLIVNLPSAATLIVDGTVTRQTSGIRTFVTPTLEKGKLYKYSLKAEVKVGEKTEVITKDVEVRAGEKTVATLSLPTAAVAAR
jgi:uncharacterized protein (TIGR03000 family)